ncbi:hypothetical protein AG1IA_10419 [Rhizoctonia solani AG-1 IA]|uniref:Uncharacterized protein n=1 Tax=Thanatephorus cucumeris (strain AG1-IA) TaxID=983506 RepID=L8WBJ7_THACA|nr:hypothetical protein AG1IA_10419 [Rhizoctonia solani AG-1 IA]
MNRNLNPIVVKRFRRQYCRQYLTAAQTQTSARPKVPLTSLVSPWLATTSFDCLEACSRSLMLTSDPQASGMPKAQVGS